MIVESNLIGSAVGQQYSQTLIDRFWMHFWRQHGSFGHFSLSKCGWMNIKDCKEMHEKSEKCLQEEQAWQSDKSAAMKRCQVHRSRKLNERQKADHTDDGGRIRANASTQDTRRGG